LTTDLYTLSLHDALPISTIGASKRVVVRPFALEAKRLIACIRVCVRRVEAEPTLGFAVDADGQLPCARFEKRSQHGHFTEFRMEDRKSTRLNSSHSQISY